jgi:hypothetical protein
MKTCSICGEEGLSWFQTGGRWYLARVKGSPHLCPKPPRTATPAREHRAPVDTEHHRRISERLNKSSVFNGE